jgi:hypothetical protein
MEETEMKTSHRFLAVIVGVLLVGVLVGCGRNRPDKPPAEALAKTEANPETTPVKVAPAEPALDAIQVDVKEKRIEIQGVFCLQEGILDYLAVTSGGQEYESVVSLRCKGSLVHAGLLSLGAVPGPTPQVLQRLRQNPPKDRELPKQVGTSLNITCEWEKDGKTVSVPASELLFNRKLKKGQDKGRWCFTGSYFAKDPDGKEFYMSDIERSLIGVFYAPSAVINFEEDAGDPYEGEDIGYSVNKQVIPPRDTPVKLIITLAGPAANK